MGALLADISLCISIVKTILTNKTSWKRAKNWFVFPTGYLREEKEKWDRAGRGTEM